MTYDKPMTYWGVIDTRRTSNSTGMRVAWMAVNCALVTFYFWIAHSLTGTVTKEEDFGTVLKLTKPTCWPCPSTSSGYLIQRTAVLQKQFLNHPNSCYFRDSTPQSIQDAPLRDSMALSQLNRWPWHDISPSFNRNGSYRDAMITFWVVYAFCNILKHTLGALC